METHFSQEQLKDKNAKPGVYEAGDCQWQKGERLMLRASELDKANLFAGENYGLATLYNIWGEFDRALEQTARHPIPGFLWYDIHAGLAADGAGNSEQAVKHFESIKSFVKSDSIDAVYISTPHTLHAELSIKAAGKGKHIICEKPAAINFKEALSVIEKVKEAGVFYMYNLQPPVLTCLRFYINDLQPPVLTCFWCVALELAPVY